MIIDYSKPSISISWFKELLGRYMLVGIWDLILSKKLLYSEKSHIKDEDDRVNLSRRYSWEMNES